MSESKIGTISLDELKGNPDNPHTQLKSEDFTSTGDLKTEAAELALVVQSAQQSKAFIANKQWALLWRDADLLFQSPRPMTVYENTYTLEPNVQRFTVAKVCNAIVPQLYKGLFYDDPPMILRPNPGTSQRVTDAKTALFSFLLNDCEFKTQTKWGLEQMALFGTGIWKWGYDWKEIVTKKRTATTVKIQSGGDLAPEDSAIATDEPPNITVTTKSVPLPFIEFRPIDKVLVDPQLMVSDIRQAGWVIDVRYMDYYQLLAIRTAIQKAIDSGSKDDSVSNWRLPTPEVMKTFWAEGQESAQTLESDQATYVEGVVHHSEKINIKVSPDPLRKKLEVLEYWDKDRKIMVLNQKNVIFSGKNEFKQIPFLSSNWWNRPKAFYGMGLGLIVGQNQRVDQGTINSILKILSFGVNPFYLRNRDDNAPTQMIRSNIGKILTVNDTEKAYRLMETPKVPADIWAALKESEQATESSSGADQQLVQGSSSGPRSSMGRTAGGANILAGASATRLDGPLDNFIEQVFKPFLYILDMLVYTKMSDVAILAVLGKDRGDDYIKDFNMQHFHDAQFEYEVLAGASLSAARTMAQSMEMLSQFLENPQINQFLSEQHKYIDYVTIFDMWMSASKWKNNQDIIKPMTPDMIKRQEANSKAALMQQQVAAKQQDSQQKQAGKEQLLDQASNNRVKEELVRAAAKANSMSEVVNGEPSTTGLAGQMPNV